MNIQSQELSPNHWVLAINPRNLSDEGTDPRVSSGRQPRPTQDYAWTGSGWSNAMGLKFFTTQADAEDSLRADRSVMEAAQPGR